MTKSVPLPSWELEYCRRCGAVLVKSTRLILDGDIAERVIELSCTGCSQIYVFEQTMKQAMPVSKVEPIAQAYQAHQSAMLEQDETQPNGPRATIETMSLDDLRESRMPHANSPRAEHPIPAEESGSGGIIITILIPLVFILIVAAYLIIAGNVP